MVWLGMLLTALLFVRLFLQRQRARWMGGKKPASSHTLMTGDEWQVSLHAYPAPERRHAQSIILFHGLGGKESLWGLLGEESWIGALHRAGYDVWTCSWRGEGVHRPAYMEARYAWGWPVDAMLEEDLPTFWEGLARIVGAEGYHLVGHGLGGRLLLMSLREKTDHRVLSCTLLGVGDAPLLPPSLPMGRMASRWWAAWLPWPEMALWSSMALRWLRRSRWLALGFAPSLGRDLRPIQAYLQAGCARISTPVFRQWWHWFRRREGRLAELPVSSVVSPSEGSERVRWLLVAGDADPMAPLEAIYRLQAQILDAQTEILQLPEIPALHGGSYSHLDLLLSPSLSEDLFPRWLAWLEGKKNEEKKAASASP